MRRIATWNINSARLRIDLIERFLAEEVPDVLCLQETKSPVEKLPVDRFEAAGYGHWAARGQPGYNGVAVLSRWPLEDLGAIDFCAMGDARHIAVSVSFPGAEPVTLHNVYTPAGGDEPDVEANPKFRHKLDFVDEMAERFAEAGPRSVVLGDLNIAPLEQDVWSHKQLLKVVSHTPVEVEKFTRAQAAGGWIDAARRITPESEKLYSWWSYRARDWAASNRGRRLDHIWLSPDLGEALTDAAVIKAARGWEKPSDHAPVIASLAIGARE
ncbi:MAG: exodeoxyribonuclease III [Pseudomonadota bacterium]